jgi:hypothetical protein
MKKISAFIESKAEIQELFASQPQKKRKLVGFILSCCVDIKMNQLLGIFFEQYEGMTTSTNFWIQTQT